MTNIVSKERQDEIDRLYRSPKERAEEVNATLQLAAKEFDIEHTRLDITCFSVQWLALTSSARSFGER